MRFLLLGGTGQVGEEFRALTLPKSVEIVAPSRTALDLTDIGTIIRTLASTPWSAVINAAAYTDVDMAEREEIAAFAVNADAPSRLAEECGQRGIPLIHISTDYVFDGRKGAPYVEQDVAAPLNAYGRSKFAGECRVSLANPRHIILRTSWVYSPYRRNFVKAILRLAAERDSLSVVTDQRGCPTSARDIAEACLTIAIRCALEPANVPYGIFHYAGAGDASWFEFAGTILEIIQERTGKSTKLTPISASEYRTPTFRPADTRLNCDAVVNKFGVKLQSWRVAVRNTIDRLTTRKLIG
jgi:dTDP-4-dehydrorhamnose reductase